LNQKPNNRRIKQDQLQPVQRDEAPAESQIRVEKDEGAQHITRQIPPVLSPEQRKVYKKTLQVLNRRGIDYAVGAAFARYAYTNIWRQTKDLDIFLKPENLKPAMGALEQAGFKTEIKEEHWLAKAWMGDYFIDLIFGAGHGQLPIDENSFKGSRRAEVLGVPVNLFPVEEMIASAVYIAGRNRFDGPEVVHLIPGTKGTAFMASHPF